ncbi:MAG: hypothetical protein ACM3O9_05645, partial [Methylocystaceae bacterium]
MDNERSLIIDNIRQNNHRIVLITFLVLSLGLLYTFILLLTGGGTEQLSLKSTLLAGIVCFFILGVAFIFSRLYRDSDITQYIIVFAATITMFFYQFFVNGSGELFALFYIVILMSVFYLNPKLSVFTCLLAIVLESILLYQFPSLRPPGKIGPMIGVRYYMFTFAMLTVFIGLRGNRQLLDIAIDKEKQASLRNAQMQQAALGLTQDATTLSASSQQLVAIASNTGEAFR